MPEDLGWFLDLVKGMGIAGGPVFAVLWWLERSERKALQLETKQQLTQVLTIAGQAATAVVQVTKAVEESSETSKDSFRSLITVIRNLRRAP